MTSIAIVFPGQGSQHLGMMREFADQYPLVEDFFSKASEIVKADLWDICQNNSKGYLNQTEFTQPIMLTSDYICYQIFQKELPHHIDYFAGHSLGEYAALLAAKALSFEDAVYLVNMRGKMMQEAVTKDQGAMAAIIGLEDTVVANICLKVDGQVSPANFNSPGQVVIAGTVNAVNLAIESAKEAGAGKAVLLPVSVPSHSPLMRPAAARFSLILDKVSWSDPDTEILYNVDGETRHNKIGIESALGAQLYNPVQWTQTIKNLANKKVTHCIEMGPGKVLSGLNKRITKDFTTRPFNQPSDIDAIKTLLGA